MFEIRITNIYTQAVGAKLYLFADDLLKPIHIAETLSKGLEDSHQVTVYRITGETTRPWVASFPGKIHN